MKSKYLKTILVGAMLTSSYFSGIANAALISSWDLSSDYSDSTGNGHDGTGGGTILPEFTTDAPGNFPGSVSFNNNNYIALNQYYQGNDSVAELSVSAWFKTSETEGGWNSNWALIDFDRSDFFTLSITPSGEVAFSTAGNSTSDMFSATTNLNDGAWHNVAVTYSLTGGKNIYVDGVLDSSNAFDGALGRGNTRYGFIGDGSEAENFDGRRNDTYYDGQIASVKLWDNAITAQEVKAQTTAVIPEPATFAIFALSMMGLVSRQHKKKS
jgi:hypothetical protein